MTAKHVITYHIVLVTKYRTKALLNIESSVYTAVNNAARGGKFTIIDQGADLGDHLHLVISTEPSISPAQLVRRLKQLTTLELWTTEVEHLKSFYWGRKRKLWSNGYFVASVGNVSEKTVLNYVRRQAK